MWDELTVANRFAGSGLPVAQQTQFRSHHGCYASSHYDIAVAGRGQLSADTERFAMKRASARLAHTLRPPDEESPIRECSTCGNTFNGLSSSSQSPVSRYRQQQR